MPVLLLVAVYCIVHLVALYLTRASGVFGDLFGRDWSLLHAGDGSELLAAASGDWIDNHAFWELSELPRQADGFWDGYGDHDDADHDAAAEIPALRAVDF